MTADLKKFCGLDLKLDTEKAKLVFGKETNTPEPAVRTLNEMKEVILDKEITVPQELYYMYRDLHGADDAAILKKNELRYDVTIIKPDMLGREFMKTAGHYHPGDYGELYEVVYGRCYCMLQRPNKQNHKIIEEVIVVEASAGQKIVIPPGFGHILINPGPECLVTSNWVSANFKSEYDLYKQAQGAAYFMLSAGKKSEFIPNPYFIKVPDMVCTKPSEKISKFGLTEGEPIYPLIHSDPGKLAFLNRPLDFTYMDVFVDIPRDKPKRSCCCGN